MGVALFSINLSQVYLRFVLLVTLSFILGIVIYRRMRKSQSWRMKPMTLFDFDEPPISKRCAIGTSLIIALPFLIIAYVDTWQYFYRISQDGDRFYLHYLFPKQAIDLGMDKLKIRTQYEIRRGYRIILIDSHGHSYSSQIMDGQETEANLSKLDNALKPYRNQ